MSTPPASALSDLHRRHLLESGIHPDVIAERGPVSLDRERARDLHFGRSGSGLWLPVHTPDGGTPFGVLRPDAPTPDARGRPRKYLLPRGASMRVDCPPRCRAGLADPAVTLWITEGQKKADALASRGMCAIDLLGVWGFKGRNRFGGSTILGVDFGHIAWVDQRTGRAREVRVVFDSDVSTKPEVRAALDQLRAYLGSRGAEVGVVHLPAAADGGKVGVDDYLLSHSVDELRALAQRPPSPPRAATPSVRWLDEPPVRLDRPLAFVDGRAYAATWVWVERTVIETTDKNGSVVAVSPPRIDTAPELVVTRGDGEVFGPGAAPLEALDLEVVLPLQVRPERALSVGGLRRLQAGDAPDPVSVFGRLVQLYDHFLDFARSLAPQRDMAELSACLSLSTWFAAVFDVLGYAWPNGEPGSGKTTWGILWASTSYLGEVLTAGSSFAALRDLADYGAALLVDDAESLGDKRFDPDKRALLLAGNRRGATVPLKELAPDGRRWVTRYVNAFCPKGFTAIRLPDPVLGSRSIVIPLVKSLDSARANRDPVDTARWPVPHRRLLDDLWLLALREMPEAEAVWHEFDGETEFVGRAFEPWRAVLAVARLFARRGVAGLEARMRGAARAYQREKADLVDQDRTLVVVRALVDLAVPATAAGATGGTGATGVLRRTFSLSSKDVAERAKAHWEGDDPAEPERIFNLRAVGRTLRRLRLTQDPDHSARRLWQGTVLDVVGIARAYGAALPEWVGDAVNAAESGADPDAPPGDAPPQRGNASSASRASSASPPDAPAAPERRGETAAAAAGGGRIWGAV